MESSVRLDSLSVGLRVCPARLTNPALACHNDEESKSLVVFNIASKCTWNCGLNRPESRLITNAMSWLCKGDHPKYTPTLDLFFLLLWIL